jgi:hypothetical protein
VKEYHKIDSVFKRDRFRKFRKCELTRAAWTHGPRTDILANAPACSKWVKAAIGEAA